MNNQDFLFQAMIFLAAAVISVPVAKRLGMVSALGYLLAGVVIGPYVLGLVGAEGADIMHFAEIGVVMMLFLIGLELKPARLWTMRREIFGLGGFQLLATAIAAGGISLLFGMNAPWGRPSQLRGVWACRLGTIAAYHRTGYFHYFRRAVSGQVCLQVYCEYKSEGDLYSRCTVDCHRDCRRSEHQLPARITIIQSS